MALLCLLYFACIALVQFPFNWIAASSESGPFSRPLPFRLLFFLVLAIRSVFSVQSSVFFVYSYLLSQLFTLGGWLLCMWGYVGQFTIQQLACLRRRRQLTEWKYSSQEDVHSPRRKAHFAFCQEGAHTTSLTGYWSRFLHYSCLCSSASFSSVPSVVLQHRGTLTIAIPSNVL